MPWLQGGCVVTVSDPGAGQQQGRECGSLIPFTWHEQIRCERRRGHAGDHWCEDTGWSNEDEPAPSPTPPARDSGRDEAREAVARLFHETYERLAPDYGYRTREASAVPWEEVPATNRALMIATVGAVLPELVKLLRRPA